MEWFGGSINDAIALAKVKGVLFVVAVHGEADSEAATAYLKKLDSAGVGGALRESGAVCIRVESGSQLCRQFSAVYPVVVVPALYFIDAADGVNVEVAGGDAKTEAELAESTRKAIDFVKNKKAAASVASPRGARVEAAQSSLAEAAGGSGNDSTDKSESSNSGLSLEERVARAKLLLAKQQAKKAQEEGQSEKSKETERRELGKALQEQKRRREEEEARQLAEERRKDKEEERLARERVRKQIEQDRLERAAKFDKEKERQRQEAEKERLKKQEEQVKKLEEEAIANSSVARVQFRLPDGRSSVERFDPDGPLEALYRHVEDAVRPPFSRFTLSTTFPSRQLDAQDRGATLRQLGLVPTATVLVLPAGGGGGSAGALLPAGNNIVALLLSPFTWLWGIISVFLFGRGPSDPPPQTRTPQQQQQQQQRGSPYSSDGSNIARLRRRENDDDEDNNTYNGNSTQQM